MTFELEKNLETFELRGREKRMFQTNTRRCTFSFLNSYVCEGERERERVEWETKETKRKKMLDTRANERTRPTRCPRSREIRMGVKRKKKTVDPCVDRSSGENARGRQLKKKKERKKERKKKRKKKEEMSGLSFLSLTLQRGCYHGVT